MYEIIKNIIGYVYIYPFLKKNEQNLKKIYEIYFHKNKHLITHSVNYPINVYKYFIPTIQLQTYKPLYIPKLKFPYVKIVNNETNIKKINYEEKIKYYVI